MKEPLTPDQYIAAVHRTLEKSNAQHKTAVTIPGIWFPLPAYFGEGEIKEVLADPVIKSWLVYIGNHPYIEGKRLLIFETAAHDFPVS